MPEVGYPAYTDEEIAYIVEQLSAIQVRGKPVFSVAQEFSTVGYSIKMRAHGTVATAELKRIPSGASYEKREEERIAMHNKLTLTTQALIVDIDGTLALRDSMVRRPYEFALCETDAVNNVVFDIMNQYKETMHILLVTGRAEQWRPQTVRWLSTHAIPYDQLLMRSTGDNRHDTIVKQELYAHHIKGKYDIFFVLDDRDRVVTMWRSLGLVCLQVAEGDF